MSDTELDQRVEELYEEREQQYRDLNVRDHVDGKRFIVDCPGECGRPMVLGRGWMGCTIPKCPECNDSADSWSEDPRISEGKAETVSDGPADITELVRG